MKVLIVVAHPDQASLTHSFTGVANQQLQRDGHEVQVTDLYAMRWKSEIDRDDFPGLTETERLIVSAASDRAFHAGSLTEDVKAEQAKLLWADGLILAFPLWWFTMPAIMKGWVERTLSHGLGYGLGAYNDTHWGDRYGEGAMAGKRGMLLVMLGGAQPHYDRRGINGPIDDILFPITHGVLFYPGFNVLPSFVSYRADRMTPERFENEGEHLRERMRNFFTAEPIPYRMQNGGDYLIPSLQLRAELSPGIDGFAAHSR
ncbi:NAD(P)H-dependent oxidoreductase [Sphingobium chlorophenolicum]|uniref:Quinone family NAD n=1 Tax=Sphingobium chlorophenolicum TaxID=46429 RepID=A0A081RFD9_SPHCR|nr:NAD(P)H-dependent oxidoreductase [Sphingobium chlorophenolicum]KEQ53912.1 Quinone family NAD [Sphingobium chlorophenolicum]